MTNERRYQLIRSLMFTALTERAHNHYALLLYTCENLHMLSWQPPQYER